MWRVPNKFKYRILRKEGSFYPQRRMYGFIWCYYYSLTSIYDTPKRVSYENIDKARNFLIKKKNGNDFYKTEVMEYM